MAQQCGQFCEHSVCTWKNVYSTVHGCTVTCVHTHHTYILEVKASGLLTGLFKSISLLTEICHYLRRKRELNAVLTYLHFFSGLCLTNSYCFKSFPTLPIRCVFLSYFVLKILLSLLFCLKNFIQPFLLFLAEDCSETSLSAITKGRTLQI